MTTVPTPEGGTEAEREAAVPAFCLGWDDAKCGAVDCHCATPPAEPAERNPHTSTCSWEQRTAPVCDCGRPDPAPLPEVDGTLTEAERQQVYISLTNVPGLSINNCNDAIDRVAATVDRILTDRLAARAETERGLVAVGLLNDLVTAKKLRLDTEEWQLVWDRVFRFLAAPETKENDRG